MTVQRPELLTAAVDSGLAEHNADNAAVAGAGADVLVHAVAEGPGIGAASGTGLGRPCCGMLLLFATAPRLNASCACCACESHG